MNLRIFEYAVRATRIGTNVWRIILKGRSVRRVIRASKQFVLRGETGNEGSHEITVDKQAVLLIFN